MSAHVMRILLVGLLLVPGRSWAEAPQVAAEGLSILFIGNSLTYSNDLPDMLGAMLEWGGVVVARIDSRARPDFGLQDHWSSTTTRKAIASRKWDWVILQQGPSATEGRPSLLEYTQRFAPEIRQAGARPALYMVWPSVARLRDFPGVADSYRAAAGAVDGLLLPVGEAWMIAMARDPGLELYGHDGFHPSRLGTYLAALVMYQQITGQDPHSLPDQVPGARGHDVIDPAVAADIKNAAVAANRGDLARLKSQ